jgi:hypothetical protein
MNHKFCTIISLISFLIFIETQQVDGQDSHYWIHQYGTRADLLSGLVVGSVKDLSSTYYNPGAIPLSPEQSLILTTDAVELSSITVKNGTSEGRDLTSTQSGSAPGIFAVRLTSSASVKHHWAFSFLTKNNFKLGIDARNIDSRQPGIGNFAQDYFSGEIIFSQKLDETWVGITYGRNVWDRVAFGITQYIAVRNQRGRSQFIGQLYKESGAGSSLIYFKDYKYTHIRAISKIGFSFAYKPLSFGFTITTPGWGILGEGETLFNLSVTEVDTGTSGTPQSGLTSDFQQRLEATYNSPLSIAAGATYYFTKSSLYFTVEWFDRQNKYRIIQPESFISQSSGRVISINYAHESNSVTNFGFGIQHTFHDELSIYTSMILDRTTKSKDTETDFAISNWDIYHITLGSALTFWRLDLTLGITYSFGSENIDQLIKIDGAENQNIFEGEFNPTKVNYRRIKLIIGFSILSDPSKGSS